MYTINFSEAPGRTKNLYGEPSEHVVLPLAENSFQPASKSLKPFSSPELVEFRELQAVAVRMIKVVSRERAKDVFTI